VDRTGDTFGSRGCRGAYATSILSLRVRLHMMQQSSGHATPAEAVASGRVSEQLQEAMVQSQPACALVRKKPAAAGRDKALSTQLQKKPACRKKRVAQQNQIANGKRARIRVFEGRKQKTQGGLRKDDLVRNARTNKIVSKRVSQGSQANVGKTIGKWVAAVKEARKVLEIKGWCPVGGKTEKGKALYAKTKEFLR
jgi:hypothetical protein